MDTNNRFAVPDLVDRSARWWPDEIAVVSSAGQLTYRELDEQVSRLANGLLELGIQKGENVAVLFRNSIEFIVSYLGVSAAGGVVVPLNIRLAPAELAYQMADSDCVGLIFGGEFTAVVDEIREDLGLRTYIAHDPPTPVPEDTVVLRDVIERSSADPPGVDVGLDDPCVILYTAGTTGFPKGAIRTHGAQFWPTVENVQMCGITDESVIFGVLPFFHHGGWFIAPLSALLVGATVVIGGEGPFDGEEFLQTIDHEGVNVVLVVPTMVEAIIDRAEQVGADLSSLSVLVNAAAPLRDDTLASLRQLLPNTTKLIPNAYAQSEGSWYSYVPPGRIDKAHTIGLPSNFVRLRVVDGDGQDVQPGETGQIVVQGPGMFQGYYDEPGQTASTIVDGWVRTGDLGSWDDDGFLIFAGRSRDMLKSGGENVYAAEVERVLNSHPEVAESACIGLPDAKWVEAVTAVIVPTKDATLDEDAVVALCREELAGYKCPKHVFFVDALPRTFKGEVQKHQLIDRFASAGNDADSG